MKKEITLRITILASLLIILVSMNSYFFLVKLGGFSLLITSVIDLIFFLVAFIFIIILIVRIIKIKLYRNWKNFVVIAISIFAFILIIFFPLQATGDTFQSPIKMKYCYEGTMNASRLYLRENGEFEDYNIGFFGYIHYENGYWLQSGDTIILNFTKGERKHLGEKLICIDSYLYKIEADTLLNTFYYEGECKGLN